jgi:hypothetical protein
MTVPRWGRSVAVRRGMQGNDIQSGQGLPQVKTRRRGSSANKGGDLSMRMAFIVGGAIVWTAATLPLSPANSNIDASPSWAAFNTPKTAKASSLQAAEVELTTSNHTKKEHCGLPCGKYQCYDKASRCGYARRPSMATPSPVNDTSSACATLTTIQVKASPAKSKTA